MSDLTKAIQELINVLDKNKITRHEGVLLSTWLILSSRNITIENPFTTENFSDAAEILLQYVDEINEQE